MTNLNRIKAMDADGLAMILMCPNESGDAEIECDKYKTFRAGIEVNCYECIRNWLDKESDK